MPELTREERIAKALAMSKSEDNTQEEVLQEETTKQLSREERIAKALELSQAEDKKKSQSQSGSSTEESSSGTSATKKEQSSGTTKPLSLEEKKALARGQKLGQLEEKKQESKLALERKQKSTNINWDVDKETEQAFKGVATKEEKMAQAKQEAMSVGETYVPNIEEKARAKEIQEAKPEQDLQRRLNLIPKEDLKSIFEGDNELTMFDGGQRLAEKYKLTDEEIDKAKSKYLEETVKEFKRKDLESSLDLIGKYAPAPKDFKDVTAYTQNIELLNKAKEMNFEKNKNLSFSLMGLEDNDRKVVDEYSSVMDRLNAYKEKSFMQQKQGADETGKGSMVINPKEIAQFEKDLKESQRLSKEIDKIRGNNNKLFDQYANVINKETGKEVTQESFTSKYENDYMKLKGALTDATYKLNYLEKEARGIREAERKGGRMLTDAQLNKQNAKLSNLDRERNLAKAEVLALSNALFLNEDITKKAIKPDETKIEKTLNVFRDLSQGYSDAILGEFNMTSTSEKNQARMLNEKLKEVGINLKDVDKQLEPTISEKFGGVLGTTTILGAQIAGTSILTGGAGTLARGAGMLPKVFAMYDKGGKFKKIADVIISGVNFELASEETSFAMGSAEEAAQLVFNKVTGKLKPLNPIINFFTKSLVGATGITVEEYAGDLFDNFTKTGISQETLDATFGKSKEEGLEKFALTFTMGMMSMGKNAKVLLVGSYKKAKEVNPNSETVKAMESVMSEMGVDPDDVVAQLKAEAQTKSDRLYPDGKGGQLSASNMTVEQEIVLREKLGYKPLTEEELSIKRIVQEQEELAPADSPYVTKKEMDDDLKVLKGEDEGTLPETYVGESVRTEEGIVTTVTEKVEEGTQLRVPTEQLVVDEAKPVSETFDRKKAGVIDVWQDPETNELFVINGTKRVATAMEDGVASVDVNFVKANSLQEAYKIGDLKNKLEDTDKTIDAVELVKANPTLKENLDLSKLKEAELYGLSSLNESLTEELKSNPNQAGVLSIIGNNVSTEKQSEVYQFAKDNNLGKDEVAQLVKEPELLDKATKKEVVKTNKALSSVEETTKALDFENTSDEELQTIYDNLSRSNNKEAKRLSNLVENVQEKNERNSILNTALSNVKNVVSKIIKSGEYFLEKREAREAIEVAEKYSGTVEKQEAKKDFKDAFFGNPNNWVADALKMREATRAFMEQGGTFKELLQSVQKEFEFDGYSEQEAASFIKSKLESITKKDFRQKSIAQEYHKAKKDGSNPELVEAIESVFSAQQNAEVELKAEVEIKTKGVTEEKVSVHPKNIKDLYNVNRRLFGLDKLKSLSSAVVMDRMIGVMAKRAKITKEQMYGRLKFEKASEELVKNLSPKGKLLYQIVGENAQLGQNVRDNLQVARDMEASGNDAKTIRIATGWEKGKDGKWRYEILDTKMKFEPTTFSGNLSDVIDNKELFSLYPQLKNIQVNLRLNGIGEGEYRNNSITVNGGLRDMDSILLHEIQHAIQHIEGFAKGGSPENVSGNLSIDDKLMDIYRNLPKLSREDRTIARDKLRENGLNTSVNFYFDINKNDVDTLENAIERIEILNKLFPSKVYVDLMNAISDKIDNLKGVESKTSYEKYLALAGEVEARNVQTRMGMTSAQRRETTLEETEDVARDEQTVLFQKTQNKAQGAAMVANDGKAIIYALTDPNVSTPLHELAHVYEHYLTNAERKTIQEFAGTTEWTTETSEVFARGFEKYLAEGVAPNSVLQKVFEKFKEWLIDIYNGIKGSDIDIELNKPMRDIYAQMVGADNSLIKAEVEIKTELSKTGQSNIDALSKDATQLGMEPETLYDRVLSNSPTVKSLTEKYAKGVASGLYSTTEATNRLNAEIKENLDAIKKEAGLDEAKKEVAQLESALTSDKKTSSDVLRDIASKIDKIANGINTNPNSSLKVSILFGTEPYIAKAFLKILSASLKTSATFIDGFNKAITKFKNSDILKGKTAQEINDIVAQLTKATTDIKQTADLKNPITKLQQSKVKQNVRDRVKHLYKTQMTSLPTLASIEKIANKYGIIDAKTFAQKLYKDLDGLEKTRAKRMETFEGAISDFIAKGGGNIKSLFNQLSTLILKDKEQAVILKNAFINAMGKQNVKGVKFTPQHIIQITKAFESSKLNTLSGIYDLTQKLDYIVNKAVDVTLNNKVTQLQEEIKRKSKSLKNTKQNEYIKSLLDLTPSKILNEELKIDLVKTLEDVKEYLSGKDNLNYDENTSQDKLEEWQNEIKKYEEEKERELINAMYEQYKLDNLGASITEDEYKQFIYPNEKELEEQKEAEEKAIKSDERKTKKREKLETLTLFNIQEILKNTLKFTDYFTIEIVKELQETLKFFVDGDHIKDLSSEQLIKINRLYTEMISFNSASQAGIINSELTGLKNAIVNQSKMMDKLRTFNNRLKNFLFNPDGSPIFGKGNELVGFHRLIERMFLGQDADTIGSIMFKKLFFGINKAKKEYEVYAKALNKLAKFNLKNKDNYNLGVKAYLLSSPKGATEMEAQLLFELKKEKIRLDINRLIEKSKVTSGVSSGTKKAAAQRAELYQEALNDINQYDTYKEYLDAYNSGNLLTKEQTEVYELTKSEYAKIKPELIASNTAYGDKEFVEEDNYTSISYLRMDTGKSDKDVLEPNFTTQSGILDAQSGTVFSRVKNPTNVKEVLDFDFYNVSRRRVLESYTDVFTRGARLELSSFMDSKQFREVFKNNDDLYNVFKERVGRYANSVLANKRTNLNVDKKAVKILKNLVTNVKLAYLARTGQLVKQLSIINHSLARLDLDFIRGLGVYYGNVFTPEGRAKINELMEGSDSINRKALGDEQFAEAIGRLNTAVLTDNYSSLRKINHYVNKFMLDIGNSILSFPDLGLNNATYVGAMIQEQRKQRKGGDSSKLKGIGIDTLIYNKDTENTYKADRITGFINNESDTGKQGGIFVNQGLGAQLFYQFKSMAVNAAVGAQNAVLDLTDPKATVKDREIALRNLIGYVGSIVAFHISKELLKDLWDDNLKEGAKKITGRKLEREEDRRKSIIDNLNSKTVWSEYAYRIMLRSATDVFAGGVMPSNASDAFGVGAEFVTKPLYKTVMNKEYEGDPIFWGNWKELSGSFSYLFDLVESGTDVVSPYVHTASEKRGMNNMAIIESMYDAGKSRPLETTADILYFLSIRYGKGVPSEFLSAIKKAIKNNYKADDNKYERLNPFQKAKQDK